MKIYLGICAATICLNGSFSELNAVSVRTPVVGIDVGAPVDYYYYDDANYQVWVGPGWYYGTWYDNQDDYYHWLDHGFYNPVWVGSGWYYGIWFDDEDDFRHFRDTHQSYHRNGSRNGGYRGDRSWHANERNGKWQRNVSK